MNWIDFTILGIVALSALIGLVRGFVREALSLAGWALATWVALEFSPGLSNLMSAAITLDSLRFVIAFLVLFIAALVLAAVLNHLISSTVRKSAMSGADRGAGAMFGLLRGVVIVAVLVWLAGFTKLPLDLPWKQSFLAGYFQDISGWMRGMVPADIGKKLGYE